MKKMNLLVTNDGGPKHIAVAVGTPTLTLFGPTNYVSWSPADSGRHACIVSKADCVPCDKTSCLDRDTECMKGITEEEVLNKAIEMINNK